MQKQLYFKLYHLWGLLLLENPGSEESGRKTFKIETQSTKLEQLNTGYNALASIKKKMMMMLFRILHASIQENET